MRHSVFCGFAYVHLTIYFVNETRFGDANAMDFAWWHNSSSICWGSDKPRCLLLSRVTRKQVRVLCNAGPKNPTTTLMQVPWFQISCQCGKWYALWWFTPLHIWCLYLWMMDGTLASSGAMGPTSYESRGSVAAALFLPVLHTYRWY